MISNETKPNVLNRIFGGFFGKYTAAEADAQRRRDPGNTIRSSDDLLDTSKRRRLMEGGRELWRNYSVAAWAIRKHLDYVATFNFQAQTDNDDLNRELESLFNWYNRSDNCDIAGRHTFRRLIRIAEARRVIDGDCFFVLLRDGRIQPIEGDRVQNPDVSRYSAEDRRKWVHGIKVGQGGRMQQASIYRRLTHGRYEFERIINASNILQIAYWDSFDQIRGVSPLSAAISSFQDVLEAKEYALAKAKITQLFALAITREMADFDDDDEQLDETAPVVDFGRGPFKLELDPGENASFLESKHPSTEFQSFMSMTLQAALKSLDLPWSFYDEAHTNFFGSKMALTNYIQSCRSKRDDLRDVLNRITAWRLQKWIANGVLTLPRGMTIGNLKWDWVAAGVPWWDVSKEIDGDIKAVQAGLRTLSEIRRERYGDDWRDVIRKRAEEQRFAEAEGVSTVFDTIQTPTEGNEE